MILPLISNEVFPTIFPEISNKKYSPLEGEVMNIYTSANEVCPVGNVVLIKVTCAQLSNFPANASYLPASLKYVSLFYEHVYLPKNELALVKELGTSERRVKVTKETTARKSTPPVTEGKTLEGLSSETYGASRFDLGKGLQAVLPSTWRAWR